MTDDITKVQGRSTIQQYYPATVHYPETVVTEIIEEFDENGKLVKRTTRSTKTKQQSSPYYGPTWNASTGVNPPGGYIEK